MTTLDILVAVYTGWGFYRGRQRGVRVEIIRIISLLLVLAFFLGIGLFTLVGNGLTTLADTLLQRQGITVAMLILIATLLIVFTFRRRLRDQRKSRKPAGEAPLYGGIAGMVRTTLSLVIVLSILDFLLPDFLNQAIVGDSMTGQSFEILSKLYLSI